MLASRRARFVVVLVAFVVSLAGLYLLFQSLPALPAEHRAKLGLPTSIHDAKEMGKVLSLYTATHYYSVLLAFCIAYIL